MILAVDIGNTTVSMAILQGRRFLAEYSISNQVPPSRLRVQLKIIFDRVHRKFPNMHSVILCSVVPDALKIVERSAFESFDVRPFVVGRDIKVPLKNNYRNPKQVGQDRLVCAFAAKQLYGSPAIVIDFGTAITLDVVSSKGEYEGGIIVPGIRLSAESLFNKTALLPDIKTIKGPRSLIGKDTQESILSGLFYGYGSMCGGLIDQISQKMKGRPNVIVTGGHTELIKKFISKKITKIDRNLVFKGMNLLIS